MLGTLDLEPMPGQADFGHMPALIPSFPFEDRNAEVVMRSTTVSAVKFSDLTVDFSVGLRRLASFMESDQSVLLHQESDDATQVNTFYNRLLRPENITTLAQSEFSTPIIPLLSLYTSGRPQCRLRQLINLRISNFAYCRLSAHGVNAIPTIGWVTERDFERTCEMLALSSPDLNTLAVNLQSGPRSARRAGAMIRNLETRVGKKFHWIYFGGYSRDTRDALESMISRSRLTCVSSHTWQTAARESRALERILPGAMSSAFMNQMRAADFQVSSRER